MFCGSAFGKLGEFPPDGYQATLPDGTLSSDGLFFPRFDCFGKEIAVTAPGVAVVSSIPGDNFAAWDGISMAAPHVTGLTALVLAHNNEFQTTYAARDAARVDRLFAVLRESCGSVGLGDPLRTGSGTPDIGKALSLTYIGADGTGASNAELQLARQISEVVLVVLEVGAALVRLDG